MQQTCRLLNREDDRVIIERLEVATSFLHRFRGLQFRKSMEADQGLLLAPCRSVHTMCCHFAIDITMLDRDGVVIDRHCNVAPWRIVPPNREAMFVLESPADEITVAIGESVRLDLGDNDAPARAISSLL